MNASNVPLPQPPSSHVSVCTERTVFFVTPLAKRDLKTLDVIFGVEYSCISVSCFDTYRTSGRYFVYARDDFIGTGQFRTYLSRGPRGCVDRGESNTILCRTTERRD